MTKSDDRPLIRVQGLEKEFQLSHSGASSLKTLVTWWRKRRIEHLHVLRGIDFEVRQGECLAIIGRNGAGKSTLLSLLARVYLPTRGTIEINGRIAPLLELGAGFHPDLTGIENVFFNGVVLGLTRKQVADRLSQIVEFAELDGHIDSPVRTYSSGMLARLGFSVAVHVDADILLVDEVLSVGDLSFERKCSARIQSFREQNGAILLVSHDLNAVRNIADRVLWLQNGRIRHAGPTEEVIQRYVEESADPASAR